MTCQEIALLKNHNCNAYFPKCWTLIFFSFYSHFDCKIPFFTNFHNVLSLLVPCAPVNISTNLLCGTNDLLVSWILSAVPLNYTVSAMPLSGNISSVTCDTSQDNCSLSGLQCGQTYNVSVKASSGSCSGPYSRPQTVQTGNKDDANERIITSMNCIFLLFKLISWPVMSSSSALLPSGFNSSDRLWHKLSPGLLECLSWCHLLHSDSDGPQRLLWNVLLIQPHMFCLWPPVCQSVQCQSDIPGQPLHQLSQSNCYDDRLCLQIFVDFM